MDGVSVSSVVIVGWLVGDYTDRGMLITVSGISSVGGDSDNLFASSD